MQDVCAAQRVETRLAEEVHHRAAADRLRVHVGEDFERLCALVRAVDVVQQTVAFEVGDRRYRHAGRYERARQACAEVYCTDNIVAAGVHLAQRLAQPTLVADLRGLGGVPDVHRAEVRAVRVRIADAVYYGDLALVPQVLDRSHAGIESVVLVDRDSAIFRDADIRAVIGVEWVVVRHNTVQVIVATRKLHHNQFAVLAIAAHKVCSSLY